MKMGMMIALASWAIVFSGCEKSQEKPAPKVDVIPAASKQPAVAKPAAPVKKEEPGHEGHDHAAEGKPATPSGSSGHGGEVIALGTSKLGAFEVRASRDKGEIKAGGDAPIDVWIDGGVGKDVTAVRFWIGAQDAKGSVKAKADIEDGKWHTHVEIPSPIPSGSALWVKIEHSNGQEATGSFELKY